MKARKMRSSPQGAISDVSGSLRVWLVKNGILSHFQLYILQFFF